MDDGNDAEHWKAEGKLAAVIETVGLTVADLTQYCRLKGLDAGRLQQRGV